MNWRVYQRIFEITAEVKGIAVRNSASLTVAIGLERLLAPDCDDNGTVSASWFCLSGQTPQAHPDNHYGDTRLIQAINKIATDYRDARFPVLLIDELDRLGRRRHAEHLGAPPVVTACVRQGRRSRILELVRPGCDRR